eukprot:TRINITY_DN11509_c1_g1_i3.p3 TRINITY_DN11509_c1_g1~~TRINITY_DN11509_c1_g1_i3.p3  ORF type:complete len:123 (+),score=39.92 TRINITY_DN11509_c1_g1_i3:354-722(+)
MAPPQFLATGGDGSDDAILLRIEAYVQEVDGLTILPTVFADFAGADEDEEASGLEDGASTEADADGTLGCIAAYVREVDHLVVLSPATPTMGASANEDDGFMLPPAALDLEGAEEAIVGESP